MKRFFFILVCVAAASCSLLVPDEPGSEKTKIEDRNLQDLARMFAELPMETGHLQEVFDAVIESSEAGYDEEYTLDCLLTDPGAGVGAHKARSKAAAAANSLESDDVAGDGRAKSKAASGGYANPLRNLIREYLDTHPEAKMTKAATASTDDMLEQLAASGYQVYWPYSENWDGKTYPVITFDPGYGAESNYGYAISYSEDGTRVIDSVYVDERVARKRPVWVLNSNSDSGFSPIDLFSTVLPSRSSLQDAPATKGSSRYRKLIMKSFRMLRNYDSWFGGASEFNIKCGSVEGFSASTEAELKLFSPSVTDLVIVVKRKYVGKELPFEAILVTDFSEQLDKLAFMVTEDDGGTRTSWKCQASVKIQSKSYGFEIDMPFNEKDDIVWRGQLTRQFFQEEDLISGRFGDVIITFELE